MRRYQLQRRTELRRGVSLALFTLVLLSRLVCAPTAGLSQQTGGQPAAAPLANRGIPDELSASQATPPQPAPDAAPRPFLRLVVVLLSGLVIGAAHLARKFRRFLGLGVFANAYSVIFLLFGVGLCGIPVTSESALKSLPHVGFLGSWIASLSGIILTLILPVIRFKPEAGRAGGSQVRDLEDVSSANPIFAVIENAIRDRILVHVQSEVVAASRRYHWDTIKLAARRALEEEMAIGRLGRMDGDAALQSVEAFRPDANPRRDATNKYTALLRLLRCCPFSRLRAGLAAAGRETQP